MADHALKMRAMMALLALFGGSRIANAQNPVRLPSVAVTAERTPPGPQLLVGIVRDTFGIPLEGVEISIPKLQRRVFTRDDGTFRFEAISRGGYSIRARKVGYAPQIRSFDIGKEGGIGDFELLPLARVLPAVVSSAVRGGLSGIVVDTGYMNVADAEVRLLTKSMSTRTDSTGAFFLAAPFGSHMLSVKKPGFKEAVVSVSIPADSGRNVSLILAPARGTVPVREVWNVIDMGGRLAWRNQLKDVFYTREDMLKLGAEWAYQLVRWGGQASYDDDCSVIVNGGPATATLNALTIDDLEAMEIYGSARAGARPMAAGARQASPPQQYTERAHVANSRINPVANPNADRARSENRGKFCPLVYVWTR
jgi:hypothetical protein